MSFDAGSIVAKATLDRSEFIAGLEEMQRRAEEFANHRYDVVFDVDDERLQAELDGIEQRLRDISGERHDANLRLAGVDEINASITELDARLDRLARTRVADIRIRTEGGGSSDINAQLDQTAASAEKSGTNALFAAQALNGLVIAAVTLAPALVPVAGALVGVSGGLLGIGAAAGVGIGGLVGLIASSAKARADIVADFAPVAKAAQNLGTVFAGQLSGTLKTFSGDALVALRELTPVFEGAITGVRDLTGQFQAFTQTGFFTSFRDELERFVTPSVVGLGDAIGNTGLFLGRFLLAFQGFIPPVLAGLDKMTRGLAGFNFGPILTYARQNLPELEKLFDAAGTASINLLKVAAPIGHAVEVGVTGLLTAFNQAAPGLKAIANLFGTILTPVFQGFANEVGKAATSLSDSRGPIKDLTGYLADHEGALHLVGQDVAKIAGAFLLFKGVSAGVSGVKSIAGLLGPLASAGPEVLLAVGAVVALGVAGYEAYQHIKPFHDEVNNLADDVKAKLPAAEAFARSALKSISADAATGAGALKKAFQSFAASDTGSQLGSAFAGLGDSLKSFATGPVLSLLKQVGSTVEAMFKAVGSSGAGSTALAGLKELGTGLAELATAGAKLGGLFVKYALAPDVEDLTKALKFLTPGLASGAQSVAKAFADTVLDFGDAFKLLGDLATGKGHAAIQDLKNLLRDLAITNLTELEAIPEAIGRIFHIDVAGDVTAFVGRISKALVSSITGVIGRARTITTSVVSAVDGAFSQLAKTATEVGGYIGRIPGSISAYAGKISESAKALATGAVSSVVNGISNIASRVGTFIGQIPGAITSKLGSIVGAAARIPASIVSGVGNLGSLLVSAGYEVVNGLVQGIESGVSRVASAAESLVSGIPGAVKKLLGIASPSKVMAALGKEIPAGLAQGIEDGMGPLSAAFQSLLRYTQQDLVKGLADGTTSQLGTTVNDLGNKIRDAFAKQAKDSVDATKQVTEYTASLHRLSLELDALNPKSTDYATRYKEITAEITADTKKLDTAKQTVQDLSKIRPGAENALLTLLGKDNSQLKVLAADRDLTVTRLSAAQTALKNLQSTSASYASSLTSSLSSNAGLFASGSGPASAADAVSGLKLNLSNLLAFQKALAQLKARGFSASIIDQVAQAGVTEGLPAAQALLQSTSGQIRQIDSLQSQITSTSTNIGTAAANDLYGAGLKAAQGLVNGLQAQQAAIQKQMDKVADGLAQAIERALGERVGDGITAGIGGGRVTGTPVRPRGSITSGIGTSASTNPTINISNVLELDGKLFDVRIKKTATQVVEHHVTSSQKSRVVRR